MKYTNRLKKLVCGFVSSALLFTCAVPSVLATEINTDYDVLVNSELSDELEASPTPEPEESPEPTDVPLPSATPSVQEMDMKVTATVYTTSDKNVYKVVFKTAASLPEIVGFNFTASFDDATIDGVEFGESFINNGETSKSITDDTAVTYAWKNGASSVLGSVVIGSVNATSSKKISASNLEISSFTATKKDGSALTINPILSVETGTNMPDLNEKEQAVYDMLVVLPQIGSLTFYRNEITGELYDVSRTYCIPIDTALDDYDALSASSKTKVDTALSISNLSMADLLTLQKAANAMNEVYGVVQMLECYNGIEDDDDALNYQYVKSTFDNTSTASPSMLKRAPKAYEEYQNILESFVIYNGYVTNAVNKFSEKTVENYNLKIASLDTQLTSSNSHSSHTLYLTYLSSLVSIANDLSNDIEKNYSGTYKEYMLQAITKVIDEIQSGNIVLKNLPTFKITSGINIGQSWTVAVTRKKAISDQEAKVLVYAYNEDNELVQSSANNAFNSNSEGLTVKLSSNSNTYKVGETIYVKCYYEYNDVPYYLGEEQVKVYKTGGQGSGPSGGSTGGSSSGGDTYPTAMPDPTAKPTRAPSAADDNPYSDIENYGWAHEAIIGLTNAGIVNGMGDGEFDPAGNVTREQFCKMVVQMFGLDITETHTQFNDVDETKWYAPYVAAAVNAGFVQGESEDYFAIGHSIMRQDMATILYRAINVSGNAVDLAFTDNSDIADYAKTPVSELVGLEIMNGYEDGSFKPRGYATRAEASKVIWETYKIIK